MDDAYDSLVRTGCIASLKRDVLLEAADDLEFLSHIRGEFTRASAESALAATACTVRLVKELTERGLCDLAMWGEVRGEFTVVQKTDEELYALVDSYELPETMPLDGFLVSTEAGDQWVARYRALVGEL